MENVTTIGIDIAKHVFQVHGTNRNGRVVFRKRLYRESFLAFLAKTRGSVVGMEACGGAHHWARELKKLGHDVKLMPAQYVKPYVKTNKNDTADAEACAEAVTRPTMRFVPIKTEAQQELAMVHRARERLIKELTALSNEIRGFLCEFGIVFPKGKNRLMERVSEALTKHEEVLSGGFRAMMERLSGEFVHKTEELKYYEQLLENHSRTSEACQQILTIPGIGRITATAIMARVGNMNTFSNGRQFAAFLGLVPRQSSSGGKERLGGISKRGDSYIRKLMVQGAHAVLRHAGKGKDRRSEWARALVQRRGQCRAAVALANKNARVVWALLVRGDRYRVLPPLQSPAPTNEPVIA